jgi:hypothetical protein
MLQGVDSVLLKVRKEAEGLSGLYFFLNMERPPCTIVSGIKDLDERRSLDNGSSLRSRAKKEETQ